MPLKITLAALLAMACSQAQQPTEAELNKVAAAMDAALGVHAGAVIADIGTGLAVQHPVRIAGKVAPTGKVVCVEITQSAVSRINTQAEAQHVPNLQAVLGKENDPGLAAGEFDAILISNTYHEFTHPPAMLKHLCDALKPDGRLVIVENYAPARRKDSREEQAKRHDMTPEILEPELSAAGFAVKETVEPILTDPAGRVRYLVRAERTN
ncbi:MAG TPA: methyltransferase domain-containing protein [Bryobacteraceae bacterium]|jgi:precorrin-6B methylase 2|nr:methyltransferase domain-containing protein [Bryobacteraceae bacterium]